MPRRLRSSSRRARGGNSPAISSIRGWKNSVMPRIWSVAGPASRRTRSKRPARLEIRHADDVVIGHRGRRRRWRQRRCHQADRVARHRLPAGRDIRGHRRRPDNRPRGCRPAAMMPCSAAGKLPRARPARRNRHGRSAASRGKRLASGGFAAGFDLGDPASSVAAAPFAAGGEGAQAGSTPTPAGKRIVASKSSRVKGRAPQPASAPNSTEETTLPVASAMLGHVERDEAVGGDVRRPS